MDAKITPERYYPSDGCFEAVVDTSKEDWTWECKIDLEENNIPDGSYDVIITVEDGAGKTGKAERSFTIDNTPPLLVLSRPAGLWTNATNAIDKSNVQNYGATFTLKGEAADDNGISLVELFFYNENGELLTENPVSIEKALSTINEDVFAFGDGSGIYESLYGAYDEKNPETRYFSMLVKVYDEARAVPALEGDKGNCREYFFLNDDISASILRSDVKISGAYQMENGRYLLTKGDTEENVAQQKKIIGILKENQVVRTAFSLNPSNNPQMSISSLTNLSSVKTAAEKYELIKNSSSKNVLKSNDTLPVAMAVGLDEIPLVKDSLGVYLEKGVYKNNEIKGDGEKIWLVKPAGEYAINGDPLSESEKNARLLIKNQGNYTMNIPLSSIGVSGTIPETGEAYTMPPIAAGQMYLICAVGEDQNSVEFKNNVHWAMFFAPSGNAPTLYDLTQDKAKTIYLRKDSKPVLFGGKIRTEQKTSVSLLLHGSPIAGQEFPIANAYDGPFNNPLSLNSEDFKAEGAYTVSIFAGIDETLFTQSDYTVVYDMTAPQAKFEYSPAVKDWQTETSSGETVTVNCHTINGDVLVKVTSLEDANGVYSERGGVYPSPAIEIFECDENGTIKNGASAVASYTSDSTEAVDRRRPQNEFDTTKLTRSDGTKIDKTYLLVRVISYDSAGNKGCESKVVYLDQESDRPIIEPKNVNEKNEETYPAEIKNIYNTEGQISFSVSDDDGVDFVEIYLYEVDENGNIIDGNGSIVAESGKKIEIDEGKIVVESDGERKDISELYYKGTGGNAFEGKRTYSVGGLTRDTIEYTLPSAYGTYRLFIIAKDTAKKDGQDTAKSHFYLKTTPSAPLLSISNNGNYYARSGARLTIGGSVTGVNGLVVYRDFSSFDAESNKYASGDGDGKNNGAPQNDRNPDGIDGAAGSAMWNDTFMISMDAKESKNALTHTYIARDKNGKTGNATLEYWIDNTPPIVHIDALTVEDSKITVPKYSFTGSSEEGKSDSPQSGVSKVFYRIISDKKKNAGDGKDEEPLFDTGWRQCATAAVWKIDCNFVDVNASVPETAPETASLTFNEGKYTLYAYSEDGAGNTGAESKGDNKNDNDIDVNASGIKSLQFSVVLGNPVVDLQLIAGNDVLKDGAFSKNEFTFKFRAVDPAAGSLSQGTNITLNEEYVDIAIERASSLDSASDSNSELLEKGRDFFISSEVASDGYATITMFGKASTGDSAVGDLQDGKYTLTVNAKDPADKTECIKKSVSIIYDTTGPVVTEPSLFWGTGGESQTPRNGYYNTRIVKITNRETLARDVLSGLSEVSYAFIQRESNYENESEFMQNPPAWNPIALNSKTQTMSLEDTSGSYLWIKAVDALGNETYWHNTTKYKVDTEKPQVQVVSPATNPATVGANLEIKAEISDGGSGFLDASGNLLGSVKAKFEGLSEPVTLLPSDSSDENNADSHAPLLWKGDVNLSSITTDSAGYTIEALDSAGNASSTARRVVKFDRVAPTINSISLVEKSIVYGSALNVSGTASDNEGLEKVEVFRKKAENESDDMVTLTEFSYNTNVYDKVVRLDIEDNGSNGVSWSLKSPVDTTALDKDDGTGELTIYVLATDTSGNQNLETRTVFIDQDAARPIVKIGGVDLTRSMQSETPIWFTSTILYSCSITAATNMEIAEAKYGYAADSIAHAISSPSSFSIEDIPEGKQSIYFWIKYKSGEEYTSRNTYDLYAPKLTDNNKNLYGYKEPHSSGSGTYCASLSVVHMNVDLTPPKIEAVFYANESNENSNPTSDEAKWTEWKDTEIPSFGGTKRPSMDIALYVSDDNGVSSVLGTTRSNEKILFERVEGISENTEKTVCYKGKYTPANRAGGSMRITFMVKDGAENGLTAEYQLYFDNQGPSVIVNTSSEQQVSGSNVTLSGRTENVIGSNDSTAALYYAVKPLASHLEWGVDRLSGTPPKSPNEDDADWEEYKVSGGALSLGAWQIIFNGESLDGAAHKSTRVLNDYIVKCYESEYSKAYADGKLPTMKPTLSEAISDADPNTQYSLITPLYVFFKAVDSVGNVTITENTFFYNVDPQGNRPVVTISSPASKITTGGIIRMYGAATEASAGIEDVFVQIDAKLKVDEKNPDLTNFRTNSWYEDFPSDNNQGLEVVESGTIIGKGIRATKDNGGLWSLNINNDLSFEGWVGLRVYAVGKNKKISFPAEAVIKVAKDVPIIGGSERLYVVQREGDAPSGKIIASRLYESGMWVNGTWFLTGSVEHSNEISEITIENGTSTNRLVDNSIILASESVEKKSWNKDSETKGTTTNFQASFNSQNIPDGNIKIHLVAFDVAGNYKPVSAERMVSNNAPRLAGVRIASDLNGDGVAASNEYISRWTALMERYMYDSNYADYSAKISGNDASAIENHKDVVKLLGYDSAARRNSAIILSKDTTEQGDPELTIRGDTWIYPTIVGGNASLKYEYKVYKNPDDTNAESQSDLISIATNVSADSVNYKTAMTLTLKDDFLAKNASGASGGRKISDGAGKKAVFTIWDATEGTEQGKSSQCATITLIFNLSLDDKTAPNVNITPLYWKSASDNSLYQSSKEYGHIELPEDLTGLSNVKITDSDRLDASTPKVSGKIVIEGSANDNNRIDELYFAFDSLPATTVSDSTQRICAARYEPANAQAKNGFVIAAGHDISSADADGSGYPKFKDGWMFEVTSSEFDFEKGHTVGFKLYIDTQMIDGVAAIGKSCHMYAVDRGIPTLSSGGTVSYASGNISPAKNYKVDIVPYITDIETDLRNKGGLKSNNIRGASGKYSVIKGNADTRDDAFVTIKGFNLNPSAVKIVNAASREAADSGKALSYSGGGKTLTDDGKMKFNCTNNFNCSGYLEVWTNGVRAINNINNNDAHGSYSKRGSYTNYTQRATDYQNMYNREPDLYVTSNIQLTDDRYILLFDMKKTDVVNGYYPTMIMNGDNPVFGYLDKSGGEVGEASRGANSKAGNFHPSDAMPQRAEFNGSTAKLVDKEFLIKASAWDQMSMARDSAGRYYHLSIYDRDGGGLNFVYDRYAELYNNKITAGAEYTNPAAGWGAGYVYSGYRPTFEIDANANPDNNVSLDLNNNALAFEAIGYKNDASVFGRYQYPKIIAKGNSVTGTASVYMCYYDTAKEQLIFRNFQLGKTVSGTAYKLDQSGVASDGKKYAQKVNIKEALPQSKWAAFPEDSSIQGRIAASGAGAGSNHFSMGVTSDNHVVFVFYNLKTGKLRIRYSENAITGNNPTAPQTFTNNSSAEKNLSSYIGQYVSMAIDSQDHIHIAAFDADDADLVYIYMNSYADPSPVTVKVEQAGSVGFWTQIKVLERDEKTIPYIAYYNTSEMNSREGIKLAYFNGSIKSSSDVKHGVDERTGYTTGDWEYMTVPAITPPQGGIAQFENVCLDFDSAQNPVVGYLGENLEFGKWCDE